MEQTHFFEDMNSLWRDRALLFRTLAFIRPYTKWHIIGLSLTLITTGLSLVPPWVTRLLIDKVLLARNSSLLLAVCALFLASVALSTLMRMAISLLFGWIGQKAGNDLRLALHRKTLHLSFPLTSRRHTGDLMSCYTNDIPLMQSLYTSTLSQAASSIIMFAAVLFVMIRINFWLTLIAIPCIPVFGLVVGFAGSVIKRASLKLQRATADSNAVLHEQLSGIKTSSAFGLERRECEQYGQSLSSILRANIRMTVRMYLIEINSMFAMLTTVFLMYLGGREVIEGRMQIGVLIAYTGYFGMLFDPLSSVTGMVSQMIRVLGASERVFGIMDLKPQVEEKDDAINLADVKGDLEFRDVSFSYPDGPKVLEGFNARILPGETIVLSGPSGSGKTTVVSLLLRFFDPAGGEILIDGIPLEDVSISSLRQSIGVVFQDSFLYHCSIRENISVGRPGATEEEIMRAAKAANAHDFIMSLPGGYDMVVGERGSCLSGGQAQRIAIARVFLKDPPIVVFDEATNALDRASETMVTEAVRALLKNRTCLVITHHKLALIGNERTITICH